MIAPLRDAEVGRSRREMLRARMAVASALLPPKSQHDSAPHLPRWRAWAWTAWLVLVAAAFVAGLLADVLVPQ
jgi:hypothetical protein